jgi:hypothetical protein
MAAEFPECEFLGVDIAPLQPTTVLPQNCSFELTNVLEGIPKPNNYFDYIHQRFLIAAIPAAKWIEIIEPHMIVGGGPACQQFNTWSNQGGKARGIDVDMAQNLDELMREVGLINVEKHVFAAPVGPWGGRVGELFAEDARLLNNAIQPFVTKMLNIPKEEVERNGNLMVEEFKSHEAYFNLYVYFGQKQ